MRSLGTIFAVLTLLTAFGCKSPNSGRGVASGPDAFDTDPTVVQSFCTTSRLTCAPYCMYIPNQGCYSAGTQAYRCSCPALEPAKTAEKGIIMPTQSLCVAAVKDCPSYCKSDATSTKCPNDGHPAVSCECPALKIKGA